jgi:hypothetical protein
MTVTMTTWQSHLPPQPPPNRLCGTMMSKVHTVITWAPEPLRSITFIVLGRLSSRISYGGLKFIYYSWRLWRHWTANLTHEFAALIDDYGPATFSVAPLKGEK